MRVEGAPLFLTSQEESYFFTLPQNKKNEVIVFLKHILKYETLDTSDSKKSLNQLYENWSNKESNSAWEFLFINLRNYLNNKELVCGDLGRRSLQILEILEKQN